MLSSGSVKVNCSPNSEMNPHFVLQQLVSYQMETVSKFDHKVQFKALFCALYGVQLTGLLYDNNQGFDFDRICSLDIFAVHVIFWLTFLQ